MQGFRERVGGRNRPTLALAVAALALVAALVFPRVVPAARRGPSCSDLAAPLGGNNRSVLAFQSTDPGALDLRLELESEIVSASQPLKVFLTFHNEDRGPLILHFNPDGPIITANETVEGVTLGSRVGVRRGRRPGRTYNSPSPLATPMSFCWARAPGVPRTRDLSERPAAMSGRASTVCAPAAIAAPAMAPDPAAQRHRDTHPAIRPARRLGRRGILQRVRFAIQP